MHVSHETIYRSLFVQSRGVLKKAHRRGPRRPRALGRRPARGLAPFLYRDPGGAALALRLPGPGHWERDADGRPGADAARPATPYRADGDADVGSRVELAAHRTFSLATGVQG